MMLAARPNTLHKLARYLLSDIILTLLLIQGKQLTAADKSPITQSTVFLKNITIYHECPCRPEGSEFNQGRGVPYPWLNPVPRVRFLYPT